MNWGSHPINLALRFGLELMMLYGFGRWGWSRPDAGIGRYVLALAVPLVAATLWGVFAVPDDPSRSGNAPIPTPGSLRLVLEIALFALAVGALYLSNASRTALALALLAIAHYSTSVDRITWLLK